MSDERIFQKALTNFTFDVACGSAIRHMVDKGVLLFSEPDFSKTHTKAAATQAIRLPID